jgi:hypothetical protein
MGMDFTAFGLNTKELHGNESANQTLRSVTHTCELPLNLAFGTKKSGPPLKILMDVNSMFWTAVGYTLALNDFEIRIEKTTYKR